MHSCFIQLCSVGVVMLLAYGAWRTVQHLTPFSVALINFFFIIAILITM